MGNKEIIIDGVDVSGCEYYNKYDKTCREVNGNYDTDICEFDKCENSNCYYKQLKRKEQKCEELEKELAKVYEDIKLSPLCYKCDEEECLQKEIDKLKAENDMLRDELRFYKDFYYACN